MGTTKDLANQKAIEKIKDLADGKMCLFGTKQNGEFVARPMSTAEIDENGNLWFFSPKDSGKNHQIKQDPQVYLMYIEAGKQHFLSLSGTAEIIFDQAKVEKLWNIFLKVWFEGGKDDPNISLLKVTPVNGHYWDEKESHLISMVKTGFAALTGKTGMDGSLDGELTV